MANYWYVYVAIYETQTLQINLKLGRFICTKTEFLNFKSTLSLAQLDVACSRLVSNGLIFWDYIQVNIQLVIFWFLFNFNELSIETKTKKVQ